MTKTVGIVIFDDAEELDFVGPYEVFTMSNTVLERARDQHGDDRDGLDVRLIARSGDIVTCAKGMQVVPHRSFADAPPLDVLLVPGGIGTRRLVNDAELLAWIDQAATPCEWVTSVCTGALLLAAAGPARGKRVTTHWLALDELRQRGRRGGGKPALCARRQSGHRRRRVGRDRHGPVAGRPALFARPCAGDPARHGIRPRAALRGGGLTPAPNDTGPE